MTWAVDADHQPIGTLYRMASDAPFKTEWFTPDTFTDRFIALVKEHGHVITSHKCSVPDAAVTLTPGNLWHWYTVTNIRALNRSPNCKKQACRRDQKPAAVGHHALFPHSHADIS